ncbi:MAG: purine nucleoside permease [Cellvibrionales bacterium]|nr:purine nucleoside permease [Cellvibrionales bacterium]
MNKKLPSPLAIRVVIVTFFEAKPQEGFPISELHRWRKGFELNTPYSAPHLAKDYYVNEEQGLLVLLTGMGTAKAASAIMALGLDSRFDFTQAYWVGAGIAGIDPKIGSLGSVAIAKHIVAGDLAYAIDSREIPNDWSTGYFPIFSQGPFDTSHTENHGEVFTLNKALADWAFSLTDGISLKSDAPCQKLGEAYQDYTNATLPPRVIQGDCLSSMTFFHGQTFTEWARQWVDYWTQKQGQFATSAMEDIGLIQSLEQLTQLGKADRSRFLLLRSASNYTLPPKGISPSDYLTKDEHNHFEGCEIALDNVYRVGKHIVDALLDQ